MGGVKQKHKKNKPKSVCFDLFLPRGSFRYLARDGEGAGDPFRTFLGMRYIFIYLYLFIY